MGVTSDRRIEMNNWIKVEDSLPSDSQAVIVYINRFNYFQNYFDIAWRKNGSWRGVDEVAAYKITHWQPLPSPPEQEN
jgi:hypothetical protein